MTTHIASDRITVLSKSSGFANRVTFPIAMRYLHSLAIVEAHSWMSAGVLSFPFGYLCKEEEKEEKEEKEDEKEGEKEEEKEEETQRRREEREKK